MRLIMIALALAGLVWAFWRVVKRHRDELKYTPEFAAAKGWRNLGLRLKLLFAGLRREVLARLTVVGGLLAPALAYLHTMASDLPFDPTMFFPTFRAFGITFSPAMYGTTLVSMLGGVFMYLNKISEGTGKIPAHIALQAALASPTQVDNVPSAALAEMTHGLPAGLQGDLNADFDGAAGALQADGVWAGGPPGSGDPPAPVSLHDRAESLIAQGQLLAAEFRDLARLRVRAGDSVSNVMRALVDHADHPPIPPPAPAG